MNELSVEVGCTQPRVTQQLLAKYAFECEYCFLENTDSSKQEILQQHLNEVRLVATRVTSEQPSKKSYIVFCPDHFQQLEQILEKFLEKSEIKYSVSQLEIKKAKLVKIPEIDLRNAIKTIQYNYCCSILQQRHFKADEQIQYLNSNDLHKTMETVLEKKLKALEQTQQKFKQYSSEKNMTNMTNKQKFLIFHFYKRLERKSEQKFQLDGVDLKPDQKLTLISMSRSIADIEHNQ